jgi:small GTP-binding protein
MIKSNSITRDTMDNYEYVFKCIFLGDSGVGKSCLIHRAVSNQYDENKENTIGFEYINKIIKVEEKSVKLQIWDTCGQEIFNSIVVNFYRNADLIVLVYSVDNELSLLNLKKWVEEVKQNVENCYFILVGNKSDLNTNKIEKDVVTNFMSEHNIKHTLEISAKDGYNIDKLFELIGILLTQEIESLNLRPSSTKKLNEYRNKNIDLKDNLSKNRYCCNSCC